MTKNPLNAYRSDFILLVLQTEVISNYYTQHEPSGVLCSFLDGKRKLHISQFSRIPFVLVL